MPRSRSHARPVTRSWYDPYSADRYLPTYIKDLAGDPALPVITKFVLEARAAGENVLDEDVLKRCIADGRLAHAITQLGPDDQDAA